MLSELAQGMGVRVRSTRNLPVREKDDLRFIGVRMQFNAEVDQVRALLHGIEVAKPFLLIDGMQVQPVTYFAPQDQGGSLEVRLDIYGAMPRKKG
jgi:Type II secretion system (T2SS), protein M subtype b